MFVDEKAGGEYHQDPPIKADISRLIRGVRYLLCAAAACLFSALVSFFWGTTWLSFALLKFSIAAFAAGVGLYFVILVRRKEA